MDGGGGYDEGRGVRGNQAVRYSSYIPFAVSLGLPVHLNVFLAARLQPAWMDKGGSTEPTLQELVERVSRGSL